MRTRRSQRGTGKTKPRVVAELRARAVEASHLHGRSPSGKVERETLRVLPAGPAAASGLGELMIRAWAARQRAA